jgi:hypothetical protein
MFGSDSQQGVFDTATQSEQQIATEHLIATQQDVIADLLVDVAWAYLPSGERFREVAVKLIGEFFKS